VEAVTNDAELYEQCARRSDDEISTLRELVTQKLDDDAPRLSENTTIFVTGSVARGDMSEHSDVDMFVVRDADETSRLDEAVITASIKRALASRGRPPPSRDGAFLRMQLLKNLVGELGKDTDDFYNHFTARMLLLLESKPLFSTATYERVVSTVIDRYWRDVTQHPSSFIPFLLINDVVRYWRLLLLNYAAKTADESEEGRRLQSYKLRFSRCLTCFSSLAFLLAEYRSKREVTPVAGLEMTKLSPMERLSHVARLEPSREATVAEIRGLYATFLRQTAEKKADLVSRFADAEFRAARSREARTFGDKIFDLITSLGEGAGKAMFRIMVV
jgi:predicted nucleotidyltransferase